MNKNELIERITNSANALDRAATTLGDKADWSPLDKGRSALNQIVECGGFMRLATITMKARAFPAMTMEEMRALREKSVADNDTIDKALATLRENTAGLTTAISSASDEALQTVITLPFGGGTRKTIAEFVGMVYWNSTYHEGQINYIQTLL